MKFLKVTVTFRDKTSQNLQKSVSRGDKIDLNMLHQSILTIQRETNDILTNLVEKEKETSTNSRPGRNFLFVFVHSS